MSLKAKVCNIAKEKKISAQAVVMKNRWKAYSSEMMYAKDISFTETVSAIRQLMK